MGYNNRSSSICEILEKWMSKTKDMIYYTSSVAEFLFDPILLQNYPRVVRGSYQLFIFLRNWNKTVKSGLKLLKFAVLSTKKRLI